MLTCKDASRLLSQSMDQPLPRLKRMELRVHVWLCSACSNFEKQLMFLRQAARRLDEECSDTKSGRTQPRSAGTHQKVTPPVIRNALRSTPQRLPTSPEGEVRRGQPALGTRPPTILPFPNSRRERQIR